MWDWIFIAFFPPTNSNKKIISSQLLDKYKMSNLGSLLKTWNKNPFFIALAKCLSWLDHCPKGCWFNFWPGHNLGCRFDPWSPDWGCMGYDNWSMIFSYIDVSLSFSQKHILEWWFFLKSPLHRWIIFLLKIWLSSNLEAVFRAVDYWHALKTEMSELLFLKILLYRPEDYDHFKSCCMSVFGHWHRNNNKNFYLLILSLAMSKDNQRVKQMKNEIIQSIISCPQIISVQKKFWSIGQTFP